MHSERLPRDVFDDSALRSKFSIPKPSTTLILRPRLLRRLSDGVKGSLTVVRAPPAAGKTMLVASWCAADLAPGPVVWLTLDRHDDEPAVFWAYVLEALDRHGVQVPGRVGGRLYPVTPDRATLQRLGATLAQQPSPIVLILDDFHEVKQPAVLNGLATVLDSAERWLRLVLITRDPAAPHIGHQSLGDVTEIIARQLAMTRNERARRRGAGSPPTVPEPRTPASSDDHFLRFLPELPH